MNETHEDDMGDMMPRRISAVAARKMLGMVGRNYSDGDLEKVLDCLYGIADASFETHLDYGNMQPTDLPNSDPETD